MLLVPRTPTISCSVARRLDPSLAPPDRHIVHAFTPDWIDAWQVCDGVTHVAGGRT
jgi:prolycopene isomerase